MHTKRSAILSSLLLMTFIHCACNSLAMPFSGTGALTAGRHSHTATLLANGKVLVCGGRGSAGALASAALYDPSSGTWTATGSMTAARYGHRATLLSNGNVLVAGGYDGSNYLKSSELYNPSTGTWTATGALSPGTSGRNIHTATLLANGKVLAAGGYNSAVSSGYLSDCYLYDPSSGTWTATGVMKALLGRGDHSATLLTNGNVLVTGGTTLDPPSSASLSSSELYNPSTGLWTLTGSMSANRAYHAAILLPNGKVLAAGGYFTGSSSGYHSASEIYDPTAGTWTLTGTMASARAYHTLTLLSDGNVLTTGGWTSSGYLSSAEVYNSSGGSWTTTGNMATKRRNHTATLLPDGKVLIAGGSSSTSAYLSSTELYGCLVTFDPAGGTVPQATKTYYLETDPYGTMPTPARTGYTFGGWWTGSGGSGSHVTGTTALISSSDHTLYAKWTLTTTSRGTPWLWLDGYGVVSGSDYEAADTGDPDGDGFFAWQEYVAGSNPTNRTSAFRAMISFSNGVRLVTWSPDLRPDRIYTVQGKTNLTDAAWGPTNSASRFFKVYVEMP